MKRNSPLDQTNLGQGAAAPCLFTNLLLSAAVLLGVLLCFSPTTHADSVHLILCGAGGEADYSERFVDWGSRLRETLTNELHVSPEKVLILTEQDATKISLESIRATMQEISDGLSSAQTDLYIYFIGHGSYLRKVSKFNIPGPDLTASEMHNLIKGIPARRVIVINGTASSAGFINKLSGRDRIICTATKSVDEKNATEFIEHFIKALEDGSADQDRDERISVIEACSRAAELTAAWYLEKGLIATEHGLLDDNGDGLGTRLPITKHGDGDGMLASSTFLRDYAFPAHVPKDLIARYLDALSSVEKLKSEKEQMDVEKYYDELETLLVKAAKANRQIRTLPADK